MHVGMTMLMYCEKQSRNIWDHVACWGLGRTQTAHSDRVAGGSLMAVWVS